ncbi:MAG: hypothetical protein R3D88_00230 [Alphaproteobacteria bacterium]
MVESYSDDLMKLAGDAPAGLSTGGMKSKIDRRAHRNDSGRSYDDCERQD